MGKKILWILLILLVLAFYGIAAALWQQTVVAGWIPISVCGGLAFLSGSTLWRLWRRLIGSDKFLINYACHLVFALGLFLCAFFGLNRLFANKESLREENAVVARKLVKERHKTRRVGRRTYVSGETYNVYYFELRFADGTIKEIPVTSGNFRRVSKGDTISLEMEKGLFNLPVIMGKTKIGSHSPSSRKGISSYK